MPDTKKSDGKFSQDDISQGGLNSKFKWSWRRARGQGGVLTLKLPVPLTLLPLTLLNGV